MHIYGAKVLVEFSKGYYIKANFYREGRAEIYADVICLLYLRSRWGDYLNARVSIIICNLFSKSQLLGYRLVILLALIVHHFSMFC